MSVLPLGMIATVSGRHVPVVPAIVQFLANINPDKKEVPNAAL